MPKTRQELGNPGCPYCSGSTWKRGRNSSGTQIFLCSECGKAFTIGVRERAQRRQERLGNLERLKPEHVAIGQFVFEVYKRRGIPTR